MDGTTPEAGLPMTPEEMVERYKHLTTQHHIASQRIGDLRKNIGDLKAQAEADSAECARAEKGERALRAERYALERDYKRATGSDLKKVARCPTLAALDKATGALNAAVGEPGDLPPDHPVVVARLAEYKRALMAHRAYVDAKRAESWAEETEDEPVAA